MLYTHVAAAIAGAVVAGLLTWQVQGARLDAVRADWAKEREHQALQLADAQSEVRKTEVDLATTADKLRKDAHVKQTDLARQRDDLARRLRQLQTERAGMPSAAQSAAAGEPAERDDIAILHATPGYDAVSEAHRGDVIRLQLARCEALYNGARDALLGR